MKRIKFMSIIAMMLLTGSRMAAQTHTPVTTLQRPKLVVGIVVDQMRWDYLYRYQKRYTEGGFRRMLSEGYTCENTALPYVPSVTAIGHTCIYTGSVPSIHGIAGNNFVKDEQKVYCTDDKTVKPVGSTSDAGLMSPRNLWTTTIGDEMRIASNGRAKVVGVSLKDRASILPAQPQRRLLVRRCHRPLYHQHLLYGQVAAMGTGVQRQALARTVPLSRLEHPLPQGYIRREHSRRHPIRKRHP